MSWSFAFYISSKSFNESKIELFVPHLFPEDPYACLQIRCIFSVCFEVCIWNGNENEEEYSTGAVHSWRIRGDVIVQ